MPPQLTPESPADLDTVSQLEAAITKFLNRSKQRDSYRGLAISMLSTIRINLHQGRLTTEDDEQFARILREWEESLINIRNMKLK